MRVKDNLSSITNALSKRTKIPPVTNQIGKVYGIVTTENTPTAKQFKRAGSFNGIGTIFYLDYLSSKSITGSVDDTFFDTCKVALPLDPQVQGFPLLGELVYLKSLPSPVTQLSSNTFFKYYTRINLWNNPQQNAQLSFGENNLGSTFFENPNARPLVSYQGDYITQGRQGVSLRFSTTTRGINTPNEWSQVGNEIDPIAILTNGLAYDPSKSYYIEQINKDASSIYLTSTQKIPLQTDKVGVLNNLTNPLNIPDYTNSQVIINGDRIVLNSKRDEVMLFAKTNIELNTKNIINLNADNRVHLNSDNIILGRFSSKERFSSKITLQPVLLGSNTLEVFFQIQATLTMLGEKLIKATSTPEGSPILDLTKIGTEILSDMLKLSDLLSKITSQKVFTT